MTWQATKFSSLVALSLPGSYHRARFLTVSRSLIQYRRIQRHGRTILKWCHIARCLIGNFRCAALKCNLVLLACLFVSAGAGTPEFLPLQHQPLSYGNPRFMLHACPCPLQMADLLSLKRIPPHVEYPDVVTGRWIPALDLFFRRRSLEVLAFRWGDGRTIRFIFTTWYHFV